MAWKELLEKGGRRIEEHRPQYIDHIISFTDSGAGDAKPSGGDSYSDVTGAGTLSSTGVDGEPKAVEVSQITQMPDTKYSHVTVRFRGHFSVASGTGWYELHPRVIERVGTTAHKAVRTIVAADSVAESVANGLWDKKCPTLTGTGAPNCRRVHRVTGFKPGKTLLKAYYYRGGLAGTEEERKVGHATVEVSDMTEFVKTDTDAYGKPMDGAPPNKLGEYYKVVRGKAVQPIAHALIVVKTAYDHFPLDEFMDKVWHTNDTEVSAFGSSVGRPGALLLQGLPLSSYSYENGLWHINYAFAYCGPAKTEEGESIDTALWENQTKVQMHTNCVVDVLTFDVDGNPREYPAGHKKAGEFIRKQITMELPRNVKGEETEALLRNMYRKTDFDFLSGWISWTE